MADWREFVKGFGAAASFRLIVALAAVSASFCAGAVETNVVSITWGKSFNYVPYSTEPFDWSGTLTVEGGTLVGVDHLNYLCHRWCQEDEVREPLPTALPVSWKSYSRPGDPLTLEGLRLRLTGDCVVRLRFAATEASFRMDELIRREHLRFHAGGKYTGVPIDVFLGPDARPRLSRPAYLRDLDGRKACGYLLLPDDFAAAERSYGQSAYGAVLGTNAALVARFPLHNSGLKPSAGTCPVRMQVSPVRDYSERDQSERVELEVGIGRAVLRIPFVFALRTGLPKMEEIEFAAPWEALEAADNGFRLTYLSGSRPLRIHRVQIGAAETTLKGRLAKLPPVGAVRRLHVGAETMTLTPENGDTDRFLDSLHDEEWGDFVLFRGRTSKAPLEMFRRWRDKVERYGLVASLDLLSSFDGVADSAEEQRARKAIFADLPSGSYIGAIGHEQSCLAYGWGDPDPDDIRLKRTLPECQEAYLKRMQAFDVVGQAVAVQHLDYAAGVKMVMTEVPCAHASLMLAAARGASRAYGGAKWGVHLANHVTRSPLDEDHVRRLFIISSMCWLNGADTIYDEEVALKYNFDTIYAYSDPIPTRYREVYQDLYHYGNAIELGKERTGACFLQGNYDFVIGGLQAMQTTVRTKFWGKFGPETAGWDFDTPEDGWKLLGTFLPRVWLYPVLQDPKSIRLFVSGTPYGQVDLTPVTAPLDVLRRYPLLILPGWNTMTDEIYAKLVEYVRGGGHLVLSAVQCTRNVTRGFLVEKRGFDFIRGGDLSALAGVRVREAPGAAAITSVGFGGNRFSMAKGAPALGTELAGARVLAADQAGRPFLVENRIGAGRVWMLTAGDYWGNPSFDVFNAEMGERLAREHRGGTWLSGETDEIDWHLYECGDVRRIVLLNTDWTSAGNVKRVTVHDGASAFDAEVREGRMRHLLVSGSVAVGFEVPSAVVDGLKTDDRGVSFAVQGCGPVEITVDSPKPLGALGLEGCKGSLNGARLRLDMGAAWSKARITIPFANGDRPDENP